MLATFVWPHWFNSWLVTSCLDWDVDFLGCGMCAQQLGNMARCNAMQCQRLVTIAFAKRSRNISKANWFEAESLLHAILADAPRDAESHLLLASVLRHSRRWAAALRRLDQLELLDTAARWRFEIRQERQLIMRRQQEHQEQEQNASQPPSRLKKGLCKPLKFTELLRTGLGSQLS